MKNDEIDTSTRLSTLVLKNPFMLASGIMDEDAGSMIRIAKNGAAAIITKSIGTKQREGYANPTIVEVDCGIINSMGLPNPGIEAYGEEIKLVKKKTSIPIIGSIFGRDEKEFCLLAKKMETYGADAVELNLSCPHAKGYGLEIGSNPEKVGNIVASVKSSISIPLLVKLSPNVTDIVEIAKTAEKNGADIITAVNSVKAMKIDIETGLPVLSNKIGGYSGRAIKPIGVRCVYEISKEVDIPVVGVGGILTAEDAIEYFMAGASAVQIGSAVYYRGVEVFKKLNNELKEWMKRHGYRKLLDIIGLAQKNRRG
ncbi:MAG: dihydroorotate dehydrogenase [Thermoplasmata archaeon]|nr:dihydroorotate dehydrogenase [Thermoplasmata archaeon]